jgi:hypothetical protein
VRDIETAVESGWEMDGCGRQLEKLQDDEYYFHCACAEFGVALAKQSKSVDLFLGPMTGRYC